MRSSILRVAMFFRPWLPPMCCLLLLSLPWGLQAQITVKITPPPFVSIGAELTKELLSQQQINAFLSGPLGSLEAQASRTIQGALDKPLLFAGLADAATLPMLAFGRPLWDSPRFSFILGITAGVQSDLFDWNLMTQRLGTIQPDQDYRLGAAAEPFTAAVTFTPFPGEWSWSVGAFGAWSRVAFVPVALTTWSAGGSASLRWGPSALERGGLVWKGLTLSAGGGWLQNRYETRLTVALPTQVVDMNLTYVSDIVSITTSPSIGLSLDNRGWFWPIQLSTEVTLLRTLGLGLAAGGAWVHGWSSLGIHGTNPVHLVSQSGILTKFVGDTATVAVDGEVTGEMGPWWQGFVGVTPSWSVGAFRFGVPLTWRFPGGLAGTLAWGISL